MSEIGHITLDNAENNAVAMRELQVLLGKRETAVAVDFDHLNRRIRCYAHIVNICSCHVIASMSSAPQTYLAGIKSFSAEDWSNCAVDDDSDDESDDGLVDFSREIGELRLTDDYYDGGNAKLKTWFASIKRDPLKRARRLVRLFRASDERKRDFTQHIHDGNNNGWFFSKINGERVRVQVTTKELLRDVKTRWDSTYKMLERLRKLRPVRRLADWSMDTNCITHRLLTCFLTLSYTMIFPVSCRNLTGKSWRVWKRS